MPARPRSQLVDLSEVGIYHCHNRCVRRASLCGFDSVTGKNFDHRKEWIRLRLELFASAFCIEICDFAVLDNHFHVILRNRPDIAETLPNLEIALRWWRLCPTRRNEWGDAADDPQLSELNQWLLEPDQMMELRTRLSDISWFMRLLCQKVARMANDEDEIHGKFWESRFSSHKLLDEQAILTCSMYVDLNAIRAGMADSPEGSEYTSVYERIAAWRSRLAESKPVEAAHFSASESDWSRDPNLMTELRFPDPVETNIWLIPIELSDLPVSIDLAPADQLPKTPAQPNPFPARRLTNKGFLPMTLEQYLRLLDWTGRQIRSDKRGSIPSDLAPIMERLRVNPEKWVDLVDKFPKSFRGAIGRADSLKYYAKQKGRRWVSGVRQAAVAFA